MLGKGRNNNPYVDLVAPDELLQEFMNKFNVVKKKVSFDTLNSNKRHFVKCKYKKYTYNLNEKETKDLFTVFSNAQL